MAVTEFNQKTYYEKEIAPLVQEVMRRCNYKNIPMFFCACTAGHNGKNHYETKSLTPGFLGVELDDHRFTEYIKVNNGFVTTVPRNMEEVDLSKERKTGEINV